MFLKHAYHYARIERALTLLEAAVEPKQTSRSIEAPENNLRLNEALDNDNPLVRSKKLQDLVIRYVARIWARKQPIKVGTYC
jgi:hypothetical protein